MSASGPVLTVFEPLEGGYLVAFGAERQALSEAATAVAALDPWQRCWIAEERVWWIADDAITRLARRLPALADALAAWHRRPLDVSDYLSPGGPWAAWSRPRSRFIPPHVRAACDRLGLARNATPEQVQAARRRLARSYHPDAGGADDDMAQINAAADTVMDWLKQGH